MILKQVSIKNFKGIEKCTIDRAGGFNLLIGNNGHGKTSILEAISVGLGGFIAGIEDINTKHFTTDEIRVVLEKQGDGSFNRRYMTPVEVECYGEIEGREYRWGRKKNSIRASRSTIEPRDICRKAAEMANEENHTLPILSYQSTARMWMQKREASVDIFSKKFYRTVGYESCLVEASNVKMMMNWIRHMEKMEWKRKKTIGEYQGVKAVLKNFMQYMIEERVISFGYDDQSDELVFVTESDALPIRNLSAGYQSLIWMVLDIAYRMALLNPDMREKIRETPGVVLIDELDMHLHPTWQWKIVGALKDTFPNVQFVAATHSPIIISSCKDENLIRIDEYRKIYYDKTPYGLDVNDTLDICLNSFSMAEEVDRLLEKFEKCIDDDDFSNAEKMVMDLKNLLDENHPKVTWAETTLEFEKVPLGD